MSSHTCTISFPIFALMYRLGISCVPVAKPCQRVDNLRAYRRRGCSMDFERVRHPECKAGVLRGRQEKTRPHQSQDTAGPCERLLARVIVRPRVNMEEALHMTPSRLASPGFSFITGLPSSTALFPPTHFHSPPFTRLIPPAPFPRHCRPL